MATEVVPLKTRNQLIMMELIYGRKTLGEVCEEFGISTAALRIIRRSPLWQEAETKMLAEVKREHEVSLSQMVAPALEGLTDLAKPVVALRDETGKEIGHIANNPSTRLQAIKTILERGNVGGTEESKPTEINITMYNPPALRGVGDEDKDTITISLGKQE